MGEKRIKPTLFIIGDSTVKNGSGKGDGGLWGWGDFIYQQMDTSKITVRNYARGGRSSRTFITEGLWDLVLKMIKPGDYVIMQFGHNDGGALNDNSRARESAEKENAFFIDLNEIIAARYEKIGETEVTKNYFLNEHTHTTREGAVLNATVVADGIRSLKKCNLKKYLE
jgi:lysophospholipase L1-like esterase